jgi:putative flippase GtrA
LIEAAPAPQQDSRAQFLRFALVGVGGFIVDTAALYAVMKAFGLGLYAGRVFSYLVAATFTWAANRYFTFKQTDPSPALYQWAKFLAANGIGALMNYGIYAVMVTFVAFAATYPVVGVAAGALAGLAFNFNASKRWVFKI